MLRFLALAFVIALLITLKMQLMMMTMMMVMMMIMFVMLLMLFMELSEPRLLLHLRSPNYPTSRSLVGPIASFNALAKGWWSAGPTLLAVSVDDARD